MTTNSSLTEEVGIRAKMTQIQFSALSHRCTTRKVSISLRNLFATYKPNRASNLDSSLVASCLLNGWNTEFLLRYNAESLTGDALRNSIQWAFPQAYYSVFSTTRAFFYAAGHTEAHHASIIRKVGALMKSKRYPDVLSFLCDGGKSDVYINITRSHIPSTLYFQKHDPQSVDTQICQFLHATRKIDLTERKKKIHILTATGKRKTHFSSSDWENVSRRLGLTSGLSLLNRKRRKANYDDIDTFLSNQLDPYKLYSDLTHIVSMLNLCHEAFIASIVGRKAYVAMTRRAHDKGHRFIRRRYQMIETMV